LGDNRCGIPEQHRIDQAAFKGEAHGLDKSQPLRIHARTRAKIAFYRDAPCNHDCNFRTGGERAAAAIEKYLHAGTIARRHFAIHPNGNADLEL
jgi:hypothetical protein